MHAWPHVLLQRALKNHLNYLQQHEWTLIEITNRTVVFSCRPIEGSWLYEDGVISVDDDKCWLSFEKEAWKIWKMLASPCVYWQFRSGCWVEGYPDHIDPDSIHVWFQWRYQGSFQEGCSDFCAKDEFLRCEEPFATPPIRTLKLTKLASEDLLHLDFRYYGQLLSQTTSSISTHHRAHIVCLS